MEFLNFAPRLIIRAKDKPKVLKTLAEIRSLFGLKGENWIKGDLKESDLETGINSFCLVGAVQEADGRYEEAARAAIFFWPSKSLRKRPSPLPQTNLKVIFLKRWMTESSASTTPARPSGRTFAKSWHVLRFWSIERLRDNDWLSRPFMFSFQTAGHGNQRRLSLPCVETTLHYC